MHAYLTRLLVKDEVQDFFAPFYGSDKNGNLCFAYTAGFEHYGLGFHKVPIASGYWLAGNLCFAQVAKVVVCASAMEAVAWLNNYWYRTADRFSLLFFSAGISVSAEQIAWLRRFFSGKTLVFALGNDLPGRLSAVHLAAGIRGLNLQSCFLAEEKVQIHFRGRTYLFSPERLSLNALEKTAGFRFRVIISSPKQHISFFEQLKAGAGLSF